MYKRSEVHALDSIHRCPYACRLFVEVPAIVEGRTRISFGRLQSASNNNEQTFTSLQGQWLLSEEDKDLTDSNSKHNMKVNTSPTK